MSADLPRVLTVTQAGRLGYTPARCRTELKHGRWRWLAPSVLLTRPERPTRADWARAGIAVGGPSAVLSGWDAVRCFGLGTPDSPSRTVLVLVERGRNRVVGGVHLRPSFRPFVRAGATSRSAELRDLPVVTAARAVCDTALLHTSLAPVRAMVIASVQRGLCQPDELEIELATGPRNGSGFLRRAVRDVIGGARSIAEAEAVDLLRAAEVPHFVVNAPIRDEFGMVLFVADVLWPDLRAILEIDSREFHFAEADWKRTMHRHNRLTALGYRVVHYPPSEIRGRGLDWAWEVRAWLESLTTLR